MFNRQAMFRRIVKTLIDRPILSIILCVALSEVLQFVLTLFFNVAPTLYYGITVAALLVLFVIPVILYIQKKGRGENSDSDEDKS